MRTVHKILNLALLALLPAAQAAADVTFQATNKLQIDRPSQTIELTKDQLAGLGQNDLTRVQIKEGSKELLSQAVDTDGDYTPDIVIFQSNFSSGQAKSFTATVGERKHHAKEDYKAYGRFNRERFDDFAWENDKIANRMYGKALETWERDPLVSSGIDAWTKRTDRLVINDWFMTDNYHADSGEGADLYSVGPSRGCGGNGIWSSDKLWLSKNFVDSRVLAQGPIRVSFELKYEPFEADGKTITEVKRITLDAGSNMNRIESRYTAEPAGDLKSGIGINKAGVTGQAANKENGTFVTWQGFKNAADGNLGCAIIVDPAQFVQTAEDDRNLLLIADAPASGNLTYWAGFGWTKGGFESFDAWKKYVDEFAQGTRSPIEVSVK